jgi:hypothetical protein
MTTINAVYVLLSVIFASFITYMFVYNIRCKNREKRMAMKHHPPAAR